MTVDFLIKCVKAPFVWGAEMMTKFAANAKHLHDPMTPKLFPLTGMLCKQYCIMTCSFLKIFYFFSFALV